MLTVVVAVNWWYCDTSNFVCDVMFSHVEPYDIMCTPKHTHTRVHVHCTHTHTWTAPSETIDRLSLSSLSESVSEPSDSGWADTPTMSLSTSHQRWYTDRPSQWTVLSGKWLCVRSHSLFLQRSMPTGTRIATCRLTRAGAASWVDFTDNQSTLTAASSCCATTCFSLQQS